MPAQQRWEERGRLNFGRELQWRVKRENQLGFNIATIEPGTNGLRVWAFLPAIWDSAACL
jgi:hypothetical protein